MRAVISELLERNGKKYWLPIPPRYEELKEAAEFLELREYHDEDDLIRGHEYRSLIGVVPDGDEHFRTVTDTANFLSMLNTGQVDAIRRMCGEFDLKFKNLPALIDFICYSKESSRQDVLKNGLPDTINRRGGSGL